MLIIYAVHLSFKMPFRSTYTLGVWIFIKRFFSPEPSSTFDSWHWTFSFPWSSLPVVLEQTKVLSACLRQKLVSRTMDIMIY